MRARVRPPRLERLWWQLQVNEDVVEVDVLPGEILLECALRAPHVRVRRVPLDECVLELDHALDHELKHHKHVLALLRVNHAVVALLEALEDLHVLDIQAREVLERLDDVRLGRLARENGSAR